MTATHQAAVLDHNGNTEIQLSQGTTEAANNNPAIGHIAFQAGHDPAKAAQQLVSLETSGLILPGTTEMFANSAMQQVRDSALAANQQNYDAPAVGGHTAKLQQEATAALSQDSQVR